ncbi:hypothetical protein [Niabella hirudinis]|uniref:hypothetical protein n=1 Tax=Niabella hirudinis TaxID=1285929 RepID=UPI003EBAED99
MINAILAIDEQDEVLGNFYTECLTDLENFENDKCSITLIKSNALNDLAVSLSIPKNGKFVFLAYSHGSDSELLAGGTTPYISETLNITLFKNSFFYTCSCSTGKRLGQLLIDNQCISYIGYKEKFTIWDYNRTPFVECANYGYKLFIQGYNIESIVEQMKAKYDEHIDNYSNDFFGAAYLLANRNTLLALGDLTHSIDS